jgi:hypothetical protein
MAIRFGGWPYPRLHILTSQSVYPGGGNTSLTYQEKDMARDFKYPVWGTQGGGLVREVGFNHYVFVVKPDCPGLDVGDDMPQEWGIIPANAAAREDDEFGS